ncbi:hypothetical protein RHECNPAF_1330032 [Rhizobium etli CNPAF512]|nr:hypothetical protein RHECNPAF_1330032 [Rhizobium etli CNPAF512]
MQPRPPPAGRECAAEPGAAPSGQNQARSISRLDVILSQCKEIISYVASSSVLSCSSVFFRACTISPR